MNQRRGRRRMTGMGKRVRGRRRKQERVERRRRRTRGEEGRVEREGTGLLRRGAAAPFRNFRNQQTAENKGVKEVYVLRIICVLDFTSQLCSLDLACVTIQMSI